MRVNFNNYMKVIKSKLEFRTEWDNDQWNESYSDFKEWCKHIDSEWAAFQDAKNLFSIFAEEFYQDANSDTHDYWLEELQPQQQMTVAQLMDIAQHIEDEMVAEDEDVTISEVQKTIAQAIHELVYGEKLPKAEE